VGRAVATTPTTDTNGSDAMTLYQTFVRYSPGSRLNRTTVRHLLTSGSSNAGLRRSGGRG